MQTKKLGELATFINGFAFKPTDWGDTGLPIIRIQDLTGNSYRKNYYEGKYSKKIEINNGDVLISWSASLGVYIWNRGKALLNQHIYKVIFDKVNIDKNYFVYAVRFNLDKMALKTHGATMKHIVKNDFYNIDIPFPNQEIQNKISAVLSKVESIIEYRKQQLEQLDLLIKSRFIEMFGVPGTDDFGWGLASLGDVCKVNPKKGQDQQPNHNIEVSFVPMSAVSEQGTINTTTVKQYDEVKTGFTYFIENDVLFAKITPCMENGKGAVARNLHNGVGFGSTEFHVLRPINGKTNADWIYALTIFHKFRLDASNHMSGSAGQRRVPASFLENYRVSVPPFELQEKFSDFIEKIDKSKLAIQKSIEKLEILKKSLMQKYFG